MKAMKLAFLLAASCAMLAAAPVTLPSAEVYAAEEAEPESARPEWVPTDYDSAVEFLKELSEPGSVSIVNKGARIADGLVCLVYGELSYSAAPGNPCDFSYTPDMFETVSDTLTEGKAGYLYHIIVLKPLKAGTADVYHIPKSAQKTPVPFRFIIDDDLNMTQVRLPDWLPVDFDSASTFYNYYGKTRIANGLLCTVFSEYIPPESSLPLEHYYAIYQSGDALECIFTQFVTNEDGYYFRIDLYQPVKSGEVKIDHDERESSVPGNPYVFEIGKDLNITETDTCGWAPDCSAEFSTLYNENKRILTNGSKIAFLLRQSVGTAYNWKQTVREGAGQFCTLVCSKLRYDHGGESPVGGSLDMVWVYDVKKDGPFQIQLDLASSVENEEPAETIGGTFYAIDDCSMILLPGEARVNILDADTGKPVVYPFSENGAFYLDYLIGEYANGPDEYNYPKYAKIATNPGKAMIGDFSQAEQYKIWMSSMPQGYVCNAVYENGKCDTGDEISVKMLTDDIADLTVRVHFQPEGDVNGDGSFSIADAVLLQRWLLGVPDTALKNWKAGDFSNDDLLNARDLTAMKQALFARMKAEYESNLLLIVNTSYGGFSVAGQDLGHGSFETVFRVTEGDRFYEDSQGHWYQNVRYKGINQPILTVEKIENGVITVSSANDDKTVKKELKLYEETESFPYSQYIVFDGINYTYSICFTWDAIPDPYLPDDPV